MKTKQYTTIDKVNWGNGPWQDEPDKKQWKDAATGLPCLIVRGSSGALCGYVGVIEDHQCFGKDYDSIELEAHGGLTFAGPCQPESEESEGVCHLPEEGEPDRVWWFGFDCAHFRDYCPAYGARDRSWGRFTEYRDMPYVEDEVTSLAAQLAARSKPTEGESNV